MDWTENLLYNKLVSKDEDADMPILSSKRQVTLPKDLCDRVGVHEGDDLLFFEHNGRITVIKQVPGASSGVLSQIGADTSVSEEQSRDEAIESRRTPQNKTTS